MGWYESIFGQQKSNAPDPLQKLDPKLREFLEKESPVKLKPPQEQQQGAQDPAPRGSAAAAAAAATDDGQRNADGGVPKESLYQDGRYAHLWRTYQSQASVEAETKSDHEKLMDVLQGYKERKSQIGRAALENCALEQLDWSSCMKSGDWGSRLTMCSAEVRKFERCYMVQSRLLKALGYLSSYERPPSVDEDIQMHADALYHRMLDQEAAAAKAKEEGKPIPKFPPLITKPASGAGADDPAARLSPEAQEKLRERVAKLPEEDRAAEEAALRAELLAKAEVATRVQDLWKEKEKERETRRQEGNETVLDRVSNIFKGSKS